MRKILLIDLIFITYVVISGQLYEFHELNPKKCHVKPALKTEIKKYSDVVKKITNSATKENLRRERKNRLDKFEGLVNTAKKLKMSNVHTDKSETVMWNYAETFAQMKKPRRQKIRVACIATPHSKFEIEKDVLVFDSYENMKKSGNKIKGKIVVFNLANTNPFENIEAAGDEFFKVMDYQPAAVLSASLVPPSKIRISDVVMRLFKGKNRGEYKVTPSGYISVQDALMLSTYQTRGERIIIHLKMVVDDFWKQTWTSQVAEITGTKQPEQIVMVYGNGYHQNALCTNVAVVLKKLNLRPKRTLRFVTWYGSQDGLIKAEEVKHVEFQIALLREGVTSDTQVNHQGNVIGLNFGGSKESACVLREIIQLLNPLGVSKIRLHNESLIRSPMPLLGYNYIPRTLGAWFDKHLKRPKSFKSAKRKDIETAIWASIAYIVADLSEAIPRNIVYYIDEFE